MNVILGSGPLGLAVMRVLIKRGEKVRMINTSGKGDSLPNVEWMKADLYNVDDAKRAMKNAKVVFQCSQPPYHKWGELFPRLQQSIMQAAIANGARLIVGDNLYMYGEVQGPIHEELPYKATTKKGKIRAQLAHQLMEAHQQGKLKVAIGRGSDFFGPFVLSSIVGQRLFRPMLSGKKCTLLGNPDVPHTFTFIDDFGEALVTLSEHEEAFGKIWHVPNGETVTAREFVQLACSIAGLQPKIHIMSNVTLRMGGLFIPEARETIEMMYQHEKPFIVSSDKFCAQFAKQATPLKEAIKQTINWYKYQMEKG